MKTGSAVFVLLILLAAAAAFLLTAISVYICSYLRELSALKSEFLSTADEWKYCLAVRELRRKYLKRLPFINENNVTRVYRRIFRKVPRAKAAGAGIWSAFAPSVLGIIMCAACLCGASWAWFNASVGSGNTTIRSASYTVSVTVEPQSGSIDVKAENGVHTAALASGEYSITVTSTGTTKNGYCTIYFDGAAYCAVQPQNGDITFTVRTEKGGELKIEPHWGEPQGSTAPVNGVITDSVEAAEESE